MQERPDLDVIEARCKAELPVRWLDWIDQARQDIPALLAYVRELEAAIVEYAATVRTLECEDYVEWLQKDRSFEIITSLLEPKP